MRHKATSRLDVSVLSSFTRAKFDYSSSPANFSADTETDETTLRDLPDCQLLKKLKKHLPLPLKMPFTFTVLKVCFTEISPSGRLYFRKYSMISIIVYFILNR